MGWRVKMSKYVKYERDTGMNNLYCNGRSIENKGNL